MGVEEKDVADIDARYRHGVCNWGALLSRQQLEQSGSGVKACN